MDYYGELVEMLLSGKLKTNKEIEKAKMKLCSKYRMAVIPSNAEVLERLSDEDREVLEPLLRIKPVRSASGVAVVAVMTSPADCPHGKCAYCPGGTGVGTPQSYTGKEPAALRAGQNEYDPFRQTSSRLKQLRAIGHPIDKIDLIIMGGTFTARDWSYREKFVLRCLDAMNGKASETLVEAQKLNETAPSRCIGLTVETRPDCLKPKEARETLVLGGTRVELGVQSLDDSVLKRVTRGHDVAATAAATKVAKDAGFKVGYHVMPGLPGVDREGDLGMFRTMFEDERFKPDMLKIYPTLVMPGTKLHEEWEAGRYKPYSTEQVVDVLAEMKSFVPPWVRIQRIQRDIPVQLIADGSKKSHARVLVKEEMARRGTRCRCVRCREVGHLALEEGQIDPENVEMKTIIYNASGGTEHFISFEEESADALLAYVRLRLTSASAHADAIGEKAPDDAVKIAIVRELKVFGQMVPIGREAGEDWQHRGYGARLLEEGERIARENGAGQMLVTSGVGVRGYYRSLGYEVKGFHMFKYIK